MNIHEKPLAVTIPLGENASFEEMQSYGEVLQMFICDHEAELAHVADLKRHNDTVDYLQSLANCYNEQLRIYKQAEAQRHRDLLTALARAVEG